MQVITFWAWLILIISGWWPLFSIIALTLSLVALQWKWEPYYCLKAAVHHTDCLSSPVQSLYIETSILYTWSSWSLLLFVTSHGSCNILALTCAMLWISASQDRPVPSRRFPFPARVAHLQHSFIVHISKAHFQHSFIVYISNVSPFVIPTLHTWSPNT